MVSYWLTEVMTILPGSIVWRNVHLMIFWIIKIWRTIALCATELLYDSQWHMFCFHLRMLYGQLQNTHRIYLSFLGMICLAVTFDLNKKKNSQYFFSLKFQYFSIFFSFHRGVRDKKINKNEIKKMTTIIQPSEAVPFSYWLLHHKNFSLSHPSISSSMLPLYIKLENHIFIIILILNFIFLRLVDYFCDMQWFFVKGEQNFARIFISHLITL